MPFHEQKTGVFLEIGVGANDFYAMPTPLVGYDQKLTSFNFSGTNRYIGIDMPLDANRYYRDIHQWFLGGDLYLDENVRVESPEIAKDFADLKNRLKPYRPNDNINFLVADGQKLPLLDASVSETYMANVAGSQMASDALMKLFRDVRRVISPGGRLTIRENITTHWVAPEIDKILQRAGFIQGVAKYMFGSDEYPKLLEQYGFHPYDGPVENKISPEDDYFMIVEA